MEPSLARLGPALLRSNQTFPRRAAVAVRAGARPTPVQGSHDHRRSLCACPTAVPHAGTGVRARSRRGRRWSCGGRDSSGQRSPPDSNSPSQPCAPTTTTHRGWQTGGEEHATPARVRSAEVRRAVRTAPARPPPGARVVRGHPRGRTRRSSTHSERRLRASTARRPSTTSPRRLLSVMAEPRLFKAIGGIGRARRRSPAATARFEPASVPLDSSRSTAAGSGGGLGRPFWPVFEATRRAVDGLRAPASGNAPEPTIRAPRPRCARSVHGPLRCEPPASVAGTRPSRGKGRSRRPRIRSTAARGPYGGGAGRRCRPCFEGSVELERRDSAPRVPRRVDELWPWSGRWWGNGPSRTPSARLLAIFALARRSRTTVHAIRREPRGGEGNPTR